VSEMGRYQFPSKEAIQVIDAFTSSPRVWMQFMPERKSTSRILRGLRVYDTPSFKPSASPSNNILCHMYIPSNLQGQKSNIYLAGFRRTGTWNS
jgi:hypothetical protein